MHLLCQLREQAFATKAHTRFPPLRQRNLKNAVSLQRRTMRCARVTREHIFD